MRENEIEKYLILECKKHKILCDKFNSPNKKNVPDRILINKGRIIFLELKATGKKPSEAQKRDHARRNSVGATVIWADSKKGIDEILEILITDRPFAFYGY